MLLRISPSRVMSLSVEPLLTLVTNKRPFMDYHALKYRTFDHWKGNDSALIEAEKRGNYILFLNKDPFMRKRQKNGGGYFAPLIPYKQFVSLLEPHFNAEELRARCALVASTPVQSGNSDVQTEWAPVFAVGLQTPSADMATFICEQLDGRFIDLRLALVTSSDPQQVNLLAKAQSTLRWSRTFKYCPKCRSRLSVKFSKAAASCPQCSTDFYPSLSPVAICLISDLSNTNCLLVRQPRSVKGMYTAVAGFAEAGEAIEETVKREIAEEVGLTAVGIRYTSLSQSWPFPNSSLMLGFRAVADREQRVDVDRTELDDARWFSREEVSTAYARANEDPMMKTLGTDARDFTHIPPCGTLAYQLIQSWLQERTEQL